MTHYSPNPGPPVIPESVLEMSLAGRRMFRYVVPIDGQVHTITFRGVPKAVQSREYPLGHPVVEFWAEHTDELPVLTRRFQVLGTGHLLPADAQWVGTTSRDTKGLVWHLYERFAK